MDNIRIGKKTMPYHWDVSNRISPMGKMNLPVGDRPCINVVRPLGGKSKDGRKLLDEDTCKNSSSPLPLPFRSRMVASPSDCTITVGAAA